MLSPIHKKNSPRNVFHVEKTVRWRRLWTGKQKTIHVLETSRLTLSEEIQITSLRKQSAFNGILGYMCGPIYCHYLEDRQTVNSELYCKVLRDKLKPAIREKRRGLIRRGVILQHDNAPPHAAHLTRGTLKEFGWEVLIHPPYSPDLAPSDFHLFGPLKTFLRGKNFSTNDEVKIDVETWLCS